MSNLRHTILALILLLGALALYLGTMPSVMQNSTDASAEVTWALSATPPVRPNHLLLSPLFYATHLLDTAFPGARPPFLAMQALNAVAGALGVAFVFLILTGLGTRTGIAAGAAILVGLSFAPWHHSRESESAIIAQTLCLLALLLITRLGKATLAGRGYFATVVAACAIAVSILLAMNYVLLFPALLVGIALWSPPGRKLGHLVLFCATAGVMLAIPYLIIGARTLPNMSPHTVLHWVTQHESQQSLPETMKLTGANAMRAVAGSINYFTGYTSVTAALKQIMRGESAISIPANDWIHFALGAIILALLAIQLLRIPRSDQQRSMLAVVLTGLLPVSFFAVLWLGSDPQFWLPAIPLLVLMAAVNASARPASTAFPWGVAAIVLFAANLWYPVPTVLLADGGPDWNTAKEFSKTIQTGDLVLSVGGWPIYLTAIRPEIESYDLLYRPDGADPNLGNWINAKVDATLQRHGRIFTSEVLRETTFTSVGRWSEIEALYGLTSSAVAAQLSARCVITPFEQEKYGSSMFVLTEKPAAPVAPGDAAAPAVSRDY